MAGKEENDDNRADLSRAEALLVSGKTIDLTVIAFNRGGLLVNFGSLAGFIPNSTILMDLQTKERKKLADRKEELIGTELTLKVIEIDRNRPSVIFAPAAQEGQEHPSSEPAPYAQGTKVRGTVMTVADEGVTLRLPKCSGFIPRSELAWRWLKHPGDFVETGQELECVVMGPAPDRPGVQLSRKQLVPNPWKVFGRFHKAGDLVTGKILQVRQDGLLVQLVAGIHGLLHRRDIDTRQVKRLKEIVSPGDEITVRIAGLDENKESIQLKMWWSAK